MSAGPGSLYYVVCGDCGDCGVPSAQTVRAPQVSCETGFLCVGFLAWRPGGRESVQVGTWLMVELGHCTPQTRACMSLPGLARVHHNTFYFSLNWLVLCHWGGKHVNYAKRQQEPRKKIWNDDTKSRTKQRTHKFYESLTYLTAIMSCFSSPQGSGYTSAQAPPPTGLFWAEFLILRCWDVWRFEMEIYMKRKGRRPCLWLGLTVPWTGAGPAPLSTITVISTLNDVLTRGVSSYGKYF